MPVLVQLHRRTAICHLTAVVAYCPQSGTLQTNFRSFVEFLLMPWHSKSQGNRRETKLKNILFSCLWRVCPHLLLFFLLGSINLSPGNTCLAFEVGSRK